MALSGVRIRRTHRQGRACFARSADSARRSAAVLEVAFALSSFATAASHLGSRPDDRGVRAIEPPGEVIDEEELGAERAEDADQAELHVARVDGGRGDGQSERQQSRDHGGEDAGAPGRGRAPSRRRIAIRTKLGTRRSCELGSSMKNGTANENPAAALEPLRRSRNRAARSASQRERAVLPGNAGRRRS